MEFNTALLHKNFSGDKASGSTMTPIYQVSAFSHSSAEQLEKVFSNKAPGYAYSRIGNPTVASFEARIAALENGAGAVACSSGMAAVTMALLNILESVQSLRLHIIHRSEMPPSPHLNSATEKAIRWTMQTAKRHCERLKTI